VSKRTAASGRGDRTQGCLPLLCLAFLLSTGTRAEAQYSKTTIPSISTTSASFLTMPGAMVQFTPKAASDVWIVLVSARLQSTLATAPSVEAQYLINGSVKGIGGIQVAASSNASWEHFCAITGTTAQQTVEVQLRDASGTSATSSMFDLQIIAFKLPANADFQYAENNSAQAVASGVYANYQALTFTPASAGKYLILAIANAQMGPGTSEVRLRLQDTSLTSWPVDSGALPNFMANPANAWQSFFLARAPTLTATPQTYNVQAFGGTGGSSIQYTRMMAFRTDAFTNAGGSYEGIENTPEVLVRSTTPVLTSTLTSAKPPSSRDYIVIQSFVQRASADATRQRKSEFRTDGTAKTTYTQTLNNANYWASYGFFDAVTTSKSVLYENYGYVAPNTGAGFTSSVKESVIHVLGLPKTATPTQVSQGTGVPAPALCAPDGRNGRYLRVTAPDSFELVFDTAVGGGIECFFDLAEDPLKRFDLAGDAAAGAGFKTLIKMSFNYQPTNTYYHPDDNHNDPLAAAWSGSPPRLDLLEATSTRVRLREEAFFQSVNASAIFAGVKAFFDYTVYPTGKMAVRQNRKTTKATLPIRERAIETSTTGTAWPDPRDTTMNYTYCAQNAGCFFVNGVTPGLDDFLLHQREVVQWTNPPTNNQSGGVRTDLLDILYQDWVTTATPPYLDDVNHLETSASAPIAFMNWKDNTAASALPAPGATGSDEVWNHLLYFKPTNFLSNVDPAVTGRSSDFRAPAALVFTTGTAWNDAAENTASDNFNESEGAYVLNADSTQPSWAKFSLDGTTTTRYTPFFKMRQWRSVNPPQTVKLDTVPPTTPVTLTRNADYRADVKPIARASFASNLLWHSTLQNQAAVDTTPDVGSAGTVFGAPTATAARYGQGLLFDAAGKYIRFTSTGNFDVTKGELEFWYQPNYDSATDASSRVLWHNDGDATHYFRLEKTATNDLVFSIRNGGSTASVTVPSPTYSWRDHDWVHLRVSWDATAPAGQQARLFFDGMELATAVGTYSTAGMVIGFNYVGADPAGANSALGLIDELNVYGDGRPAALAEGGLAGSPNEYLASGNASQNYTLSFAGVDTSRRGAYLYMGAESKFRGLNFVLATAGSGVVATALDWQYWDGTQWASLRTGGVPSFGFTDNTNSLTVGRASVFWTSDPTGWATYSVDGGPDLYFVRLRLQNGLAYTPTAPVEGLITTDILLMQYYGDITANQSFDVGPAIVPTAVKLMSFDARGEDAAIALSWQTGSEIDNLGFHVYRAAAADGPYRRITSSVIPGLGGSVLGQGYSYRDSGLMNGVRYFYKLEDIDTSGRTDDHGPVSAMAGASGASGSGSSADEGSSGGSADEAGATASGVTGSGVTGDGGGASGAPAGRTAYGAPATASLRVVSRTDAEAVLELATPGFFATPTATGTVAIDVPGLGAASAPGAPAVPTKRTWLEAVAGKGVRIASVTESDVLAFPGLRPLATPAPDIAVGRAGTVRPASSPRRETAAFRGLYPRVSARFQSVGFQAERKKALLELAPLRWDGASGGLVLARRLRVRVVFSGADHAEQALGGSRGRRPRTGEGTPSILVAHLETTKPGLHSVRFEDVFAPSHAPVPISSLRLGHRGVPVAFHVEPDAPFFAPGGRLFFVSEDAASNPDGNALVYELARGAGGLTMPLVSAVPSGPAAPYVWSDVRFEQNRYYQSALVDAPDLWLWDLLVSPATKGYPFTLRSLAPASEPAHLRVFLQGASDFEAKPDHHLRASLNGIVVAETFWDGKEPATLEADVPAGILQEGDNRLDLQNAGDTGAAYSMVFLDRFELRYPRLLMADSGVLDGSFSAPGLVTVAGLGAGSFVLDTTSLPRWLRLTRATPSGLAFQAETAHHYLAVAADRVLQPEIHRAIPSTLKSRRNSADYLLIAPQVFLDAASPLLDLRESQGLRARAVALEEVVQEFGQGETHPEAIRDFLEYAYQRWRRPSPRYVLLLGDATYDPKDFLRTGIQNRIPALVKKTAYLWTASDPALANVNGSDDLPDLAIGRLPAASVAEAQVMIQKILDFESGAHDLSGSAVLVADNADLGGNFEQDADELAVSVLAGRAVERIYLRDHLTDPNPVLSTRSAIANAFNAGPSLVSYVGHGGIAVWASENLWNNLDVNTLAVQGPSTPAPILFTMNCLNGYFHFPSLNSLTEQFLKADGKGAVAAFSPSGLSVNEPAHLYHRMLLAEVASGRHPRLGDAVMAAQAAYAESGSFPELLGIYHLFGDPAMRIR
jgi:hypothetical protein